MGASSNGTGARITIAAAGDVHCRGSRRAEIRRAFAALAPDVDLVLLAGDLTSHGAPEEAEILAEAVADLSVPVFAVLGNHDWHERRADAITAILRSAGIRTLDGESAVAEVRGVEVGIVGEKGFVGGFAGSHLPDFGEPSLRHVYAETTAAVEALDRGLREIEQCPFRIVLLHYSPVVETLEGERPEIFCFLGTDRLAAPIAEHEPDLVLHGHAHHGRLEGRIGVTPVYNVSVPVIARDFWTLELSSVERPATPIH